MKKFCESLREHIMEIIIFLKKEMNSSTNKQQKSCQNAKICGIYKEKFEDRYAKDKKYLKARDHCHYTRKHRGAAYSIHNLKQLVPN